MKNLLTKLKNPILLLGIGNTLKGDDAIGPRFISTLETKMSSKYYAINCGEVPENYISKIKSLKPETVVFVDAVEMNKEPGTVGLFHSNEIINFNISTHGMPLNMLSEYIEKETGAKVYLLGIQPKSLKLGDKISKEVEKAIQKLAESIL